MAIEEVKSNLANKASESDEIAVVIPCFNSRDTILEVVKSIPESIKLIICVDDASPDQVGQFLIENSKDPRVIVIRNSVNLGVGGATIRGWRQIIESDLGIKYIIKIDSDGQMNHIDLADFVKPLRNRDADFVKGNRFFNLSDLDGMPLIRIIGNAILSFFSKLSTGYWTVMDPTNGAICISTDMLRKLPLDRIDKRWFFESDLLFYLYLEEAVVQDFPISSNYGFEKSNLRIRRIVFSFLWKHLRNACKRYLYVYILRHFQVATLYLPLGLILLLFGTLKGLTSLLHSSKSNVPTVAGTTSLVAISIIAGMQLLLAFIAQDGSREYGFLQKKLISKFRND